MKRAIKIVSIAFLVASAGGMGNKVRAQAPTTLITPWPSDTRQPPATLTLQEVPATPIRATPPQASGSNPRPSRFRRSFDNAVLTRLTNPFEVINPSGQANIPARPAIPNPFEAVTPSDRAMPQMPSLPATTPGQPGAPSSGTGAPDMGRPGTGTGATEGTPGTGTGTPGTAPDTGGAPGAGAGTGAGAGADAGAGAGANAPGAGGGAGDAFGGAAANTGPGFGGGVGAGQGVFTMIGDQSPYSFHSAAARTTTGPVGPPLPPGPRGGALLFPTVRSFKIAENQSPRPLDRFYVDFNYYNDLNAKINTKENVPLQSLKAYRYLFGFEKTYNDGKGSFGLRFPINTLTGDSPIKGLGKTTTATGDLSVYTKYILEQDPKTGSLVSVGLLLTLPTGPRNFAGATYLRSIHPVSIQPFLGYIWNSADGRAYFHGFTSLDAPSNPRDVTMIYNDFGIGYFVYRAQNPRDFWTAIAPTFELHVNNPINHRDVYNRFDIAGTPDVVNLTYGVNFEIRKRFLITLALVTPVSSPKPFESEALLLLNYRFGGASQLTNTATTPPLVSY